MIADELVLAFVACVLAIVTALAVIRLVRGPRPRALKPRKDPKPVCGCSHHYSFHDPKSGNCHGFVNGEPVKYDAFRDPTAWAQVQCPCRQYSGPMPLPEYFAPELPRD